MNLEETIRNFKVDKTESNALILLKLLMRHNLVPEEDIRICAGLGDDLCSKIFPNEQTVSIEKFFSTKDEEFCVDFAIWATEKVLPIWATFHLHEDPTLLPRNTMSSALLKTNIRCFKSPESTLFN